MIESSAFDLSGIFKTVANLTGMTDTQSNRQKINNLIKSDGLDKLIDKTKGTVSELTDYLKKKGIETAEKIEKVKEIVKSPENIQKFGETKTKEAVKKVAKEYPEETNAAFVNGIKAVAKANDWEVNKDMTEERKQEKFKESSTSTAGILLNEFATGTGPQSRDFYFGTDKIVQEIVTGRVKQVIVDGVYKKIAYITYEEFVKIKQIEVGIPFSPGGDTSYGESWGHHTKSNYAQFVMGGAIAYVRPSGMKDRVDVEIINHMSRNSLILHQAEDYERDSTKTENKPLSTITQRYHIRLMIDPNRFKKE